MKPLVMDRSNLPDNYATVCWLWQRYDRTNIQFSLLQIIYFFRIASLQYERNEVVSVIMDGIGMANCGLEGA